ncbi:MAG: matrixin family metalloprotease [Campylobacterota bacterium]|nr:matrixin family metalloprotease [Campylobacterota bacterium]
MNFFKLLVFILILSNHSNAKYQKVKVGFIDEHYKNILTKEILIDILKDIENRLEYQVNRNIFDIHHTGKPIDILYRTPSQKKIELEKGIKILETKKDKIDRLKKEFKSKESNIKSKRKKLNRFTKSLNKEIKKLNRYIESKNKKQHTQTQYQDIKRYVDKKQKEIKTKTNILNRDKKEFNKKLKRYNKTISLYNKTIRQYNRLQRKIEVLSRNLKEVKGVALGYTEVISKTFYENGYKKTTKETKSYMNKIEIYSFNNLKELKAVLAHEIGHLVGVEHINSKGALMNPILQKNQIDNLSLTPRDIVKFKKNIF